MGLQLLSWWCCWRGDGGGSEGGVCETWFAVGETGEVEGHDEVRDDDIEGGERADAADALKGGSCEVGAVGEVEVCLVFVGGILESLGVGR